MNRVEFMRELEYLLLDIPEEEKADAISYYRDYLEEAGPEHEAEVIAEYGSPERIAAIIRSELSGNLEDGGEFTEHGYEDERFKDPNYQVAERYDLPDVTKETNRQTFDGSSDGGAGRRQETKDGTLRTNRALRIILWILLIIVAGPVLLGIGGGLIGIIGGLAGWLIAAVICLGVVTAALLIAGIIMLVVGIVYVVTSPLTGSLLIGVSVLLLGFGLLCLALCFAFYGKFLPFFIRSVVNFFSRLIHNRRVRT